MIEGLDKKPNKFFIIFVIISQVFLPCFGQEDTDKSKVTYSESTTTYTEDRTIGIQTVYAINQTKYIEEITKYIEEFTYYSTGKYEGDVYVVQLQPIEYTNTHIFLQTNYDINISAILGNLGIGGGVILLTAVVIPALAPTLAPHIAIIVTNIFNPAKIVAASLASAAGEAAISGAVEFVKSGGDPQLTLNKALEGAADGFKWGAVLTAGADLSSMAIKIGKAPLIKPCINKELAGKIEPKSGVPFVSRTVIDAYNRVVKVVVPVFQNKIPSDLILPDELLLAAREEQARWCTRQLQGYIKSHPEFARQFTQRQLEQIQQGARVIDGLTWHHTEVKGHMQLVDALKHTQARHTGGYKIWGLGAITP